MNELWAFYIIEGLIMEVVGTWLIAQPFLKYSNFRFFSTKEIKGIDESMNNFKEATKKINQIQQSNLNKLDSKLILAHIEELYLLITHHSNLTNIETIADKRFDKTVINYVTRGLIFILGGFGLQVAGIIIQAMI